MVADIDLILNALAAGAGGVATAMAGDAGRAAYEKLKGLLLIRLDGRETAIRELETEEPQRAVLEAHLVAAGADNDRELVETARDLLRRLGHDPGPAGSNTGAGSAARDAYATFVNGSVFVRGDWHLGGEKAKDRAEEANPPQRPAAV
ncbi:hypothetical protein QLQ12_19620 [Actinoplanes sp. NEAU-A12]|uniref:Uncharacterized protein n=1 Tax=Actinoplanes sandaracinus TaxID=3045177 RepID=A0ABT6WM61_9ACTN|nr:hypothetical protein [Actinoplanes sandaracinus]MDI6100824.1 hypothetical protein [Actinoplanes sandaracinus]